MTDTPYPRDMVGYGREPAAPALAGRCAHRRAVRHQLRGRRGEQHPPRRCGLGDAAHRVRLRRAPHRRARAPHRIDVRVRQPRRLLAASPALHRAGRAGHDLRRRHGARPQPGGGRRDDGGGLGRSRATATAGSTITPCPRRRSARTSARPSRSSRSSRARGPSGCFLGRRSPNTVRLVAEEGGFLYSQDSYADELPYWVEEAGRPLLMISYTADHNDHRFATAPGFDWGEPFFAYLRDAFDVLYAEGAAAARHDEHRPAQPAGGPAGAFCGAQALRRPRAGARPRLALPRHRHRPPLARAGRRALEGTLPGPWCGSGRARRAAPSRHAVGGKESRGRRGPGIRGRACRAAAGSA